MCHTFPLVNSWKKGQEKSAVVSEGWLLLLVLNYCGNFPPLARYIVHNTLCGTVSTISVLLNGEPFGTVQSFSDGTLEESTGYHSSSWQLLTLWCRTLNQTRGQACHFLKGRVITARFTAGILSCHCALELLSQER